VQKIVVEKSYAAPYGYDLTLNTMKQSGSQTRIAGLLLLLPIILNIFLMHLVFDNGPHENIETGRYLGATLLLLLYYWKRTPSIF
jgi:hypothetical protein